jgi:hypothetical protein
MKVTYPLTSFAAGEISPRLDFRIDIAKYRSGAKTIENGIVMPHGGVRKRPGTRFIAEARDSSQSQRLVPFEFNTEQAYMLEFGPSYIRIFKDQGIVTETAKTITGATRASPCVITAASHGFVNGDRVWITGIVGMSQLNNRHFTVANVTANTFELSGVDATTYGTYSVGGSVARIVEVATPYTASEIADLSFAQSADTLFIAHRNHPIAKLTRTSHTAWTLADADIENGPFRDINTDEDLKITIAATGSASITGATKANPVVITTSSAHGFAEGATVLITGVGGMVEINNIDHHRALQEGQHAGQRHRLYHLHLGRHGHGLDDRLGDLLARHLGNPHRFVGAVPVRPRRGAVAPVGAGQGYRHCPAGRNQEGRQ